MSPRVPLFPVGETTVPKVGLQAHTEHVLDARCCVLSRCRFLAREQLPSGEAVASCRAAVFKAQLPQGLLDEVVAENPSPVPGDGGDDNPLLLRLLMSPDCVRPECGVFAMTRFERQLLPEPEPDGSLFEH